MRNKSIPESELEELLTRVGSPEPPPDLIERIRADIPDYLQPINEGDRAAKPSRRLLPYQVLAASLFVAVIGGLVAYRVSERLPDVAERVESSTQRSRSADPTPGQSSEPGSEAEKRTSIEIVQGTVDEVTEPSPAAVPARRDPETLHETSEESRSRPSVPASPAADAPSREGLSSLPPESRDDAGARRPATKEIGEAQRSVSAPAEPADTGTASDESEGRHDRDAAMAESTVLRSQTTVVLGIPEAVAPPPVLPSEGDLRASTRERFEKKREIGDLRRQEPSPAPTPSTGGTTEPNDQPYGDMFFRPYGTNPFVDTEDDPQSTFGLDVDTGSYTLARSYLERGHLPPPEAIRVEEFVNFFDYGDPAPRRGEFTVTVEGAPSPWARGPRYQLLRIGIRGREIEAFDRKDATLVFVIDVSGSMARENRIGLVKEALRMLLDQLGPNDRVGLVVYGDRGRVLLEPSGDLYAVERAIDRLTTNGATNAEEGLLLGFDLARRYFRPHAINRIVLCSDGVANVGRTGPKSILARIAHEAENGIELTTVGFGMGNYNDLLMEQLADQGNGNYAYVDTLGEAHRIFVENLTATLQTIAADAKVQVEFNPRTVSRYRLLGYENRDVADDRFRDDSVDAGEIGAGHSVSALYEIKLTDDGSRRRRIGEVRLRYRSKATDRIVEDSLEIRSTDLARSWRSASPSLQLAAVASELAEILRGSYWAKEADIEALIERARDVEREFRGDRDVSDLADLVRRVAREID